MMLRPTITVLAALLAAVPSTAMARCVGVTREPNAFEKTVHQSFPMQLVGRPPMSTLRFAGVLPDDASKPAGERSVQLAFEAGTGWEVPPAHELHVMFAEGQTLTLVPRSIPAPQRTTTIA